jgi:hypothetical protein
MDLIRDDEVEGCDEFEAIRSGAPPFAKVKLGDGDPSVSPRNSVGC